MTGREVLAMLPILITSATAVAVMLGVAVRRSHGASAAIALAGLVASAAAALWVAARVAPMEVSGMLRVDGYGAMTAFLAAVGAIVTVLLAWGQPAAPAGRGREEREELYILLLLATLGAQVLCLAVHFATLLLGLELLTTPLYALIAYDRRSARALAAGMKYLVLASVSTSFLLLGLAMVYAATGTMKLAELAALGAAGASGESAMMLQGGAALVVLAAAFKLALVPLHFWTPDIYAAATPAVAGLLATVSKGAVLALLLRVCAAMHLGESDRLWLLLWALAAATMTAGNALALRQRNLARLLGCSSIANMGYMLVGVLACSTAGAEAAAFYLVAYGVATLAAFAVAAISTSPDRGTAQVLDDFRGLAWRRPMLGAVMTVAMLSLAGLPLTGGFMAKLYVVLAGARAGMWALVIVMLANSAVGLVYYLRVVLTVFAERAEPREEGAAGRAAPLPAGVTAGLLLATTIWLGVWPDSAVGVIQWAVAGLF